MARGFGATHGVGTTDCVESGSSFDLSGAMSFASWTYRTGAGGSSQGRFFDKRSAGAVLLFSFHNNESGTTVYQYQFGGGTDGVYTTAQPAVNEWHHVLVTWDGSGAPIVYIDGVSVTVTTGITFVAPQDTGSSIFHFGNRGSDHGRVWDGYLAEPAIWNRVLTAAEAASIGTKKFSPAFFLRGLVEYAPLIRTLVPRKGALFTATGTAVQPHPRIIYPYNQK